MTQPVYQPKIPIPSNSIAESQMDFLTNFSQLSLAFGIDHIPLNDPSNPGNHSVARLIERETGPATGTSEVSLYSKNVVNQTDQLFLREIGNSAEIQYSNYQILPLQPIKQGNVVVQVPFYSFLPGGIIIYFGYCVPLASPFNLILEPAICTNIFGVNLGILIDEKTYPMNPSPSPNAEGKYNLITLDNALVGNKISPFSYIIYGAL